MSVDLLRNRLDSQDRRALREMLTMFCDVYATTSYGSDSEPVYVNTPTTLRCFIDQDTRRLTSTTQDLVVKQASVLFDPDADVAEDYLLKNGRMKNGLVLFDEVIVVSPPTVNHNARGLIAKEAVCETH